MKTTVNKDEMSFSDMVISMTNPRELSYCYYKNEEESKNLTESLKSVAERMHKIIEGKKRISNEKSFRIKFTDKVYRCTLINSVTGELAMCRSQPMDLIGFSDLQIPEQIKSFCLHERLTKGGLILVVGTVGSGKTTTCSALAMARVSEYGGLLLTIEDPAELPMNGPVGIGRCVQYEVSTQEEFIEAGRLALRCYPADKPSIMFIGEIRDKESATLALRASLDGRLVVATMHGDSIESAMTRILSYASDKISKNEARDMLYSGFRLCLHQSMSERGDIDVSFLIDSDSAAHAIKNGNESGLASEIFLQKQKVSQGELVDYRFVK